MARFDPQFVRARFLYPGIMLAIVNGIFIAFDFALADVPVADRVSLYFLFVSGTAYLLGLGFEYATEGKWLYREHSLVGLTAIIVYICIASSAILYIRLLSRAFPYLVAIAAMGLASFLILLLVSNIEHTTEPMSA